jgi:hypothetical protein
LRILVGLHHLLAALARRGAGELVLQVRRLPRVLLLGLVVQRAEPALELDAESVQLVAVGR